MASASSISFYATDGAIPHHCLQVGLPQAGGLRVVFGVASGVVGPARDLVGRTQGVVIARGIPVYVRAHPVRIVRAIGGQQCTGGSGICSAWNLERAGI